MLTTQCIVTYFSSHAIVTTQPPIEEDLGDDAVKSSTYGLKNLEYILSHFDEWIPDGTDGTRKAKLYRPDGFSSLRLCT